MRIRTKRRKKSKDISYGLRVLNTQQFISPIAFGSQLINEKERPQEQDASQYLVLGQTLP
jgi:hypothetical protein